MKQWVFVIDVERCENCNNCFLACKDEHVDNDWPGYAAPQPGQGPGWIEVRAKERGQFPGVDVAYMPVMCMQCDDAPCVKAAPGIVSKRSDGIVIIDPIKAKGNKKLVNACPYGVIRWNEQLQLAQKCTWCAHLLDQGWQKTRCVQSCPTAALTLHSIDHANIQAMIDHEKWQPYEPERRTRPRVYYKSLNRIQKCFIAGSVAKRLHQTVDCVEGARVTLYNSAREQVGEAITDNYGDFKFDNLEPRSGVYTVQLEYRDCGTRTVQAELESSLNLGTILF